VVVRAVRTAGGTDVVVHDDRALGGVTRVQFVASGEVVPELSELRQVRWVEEVAESTDDNVRTASTLQSGDAAVASIWDRGLHGEGQIIGMLDSGPVDINHCFFQDLTNNTPGGTHRKVLAIRNASNSAAGDHATFVAGCAVGDDANGSGTHAGRGGAWAARLISANRRDIRNGHSTMLAELAAAGDASIHTNSWHDNTGNPATYNQTAQTSTPSPGTTRNTWSSARPATLVRSRARRAPPRTPSAFLPPRPFRAITDSGTATTVPPRTGAANPI